MAMVARFIQVFWEIWLDYDIGRRTMEGLDGVSEVARQE
jgi:hypothetical protein